VKAGDVPSPVSNDAPDGAEGVHDAAPGDDTFHGDTSSDATAEGGASGDGQDEAGDDSSESSTPQNSMQWELVGGCATKVVSGAVLGCDSQPPTVFDWVPTEGAFFQSFWRGTDLAVDLGGALVLTDGVSSVRHLDTSSASADDVGASFCASSVASGAIAQEPVRLRPGRC